MCLTSFSILGMWVREQRHCECCNSFILIIELYHHLFLHSIVQHLNCFWIVWAIVNNAALNFKHGFLVPMGTYFYWVFNLENCCLLGYRDIHTHTYIHAFLFVFGLYPAVLRTHSWPWIQGSLPVVLRRPHVVASINHDQQHEKPKP